MRYEPRPEGEAGGLTMVVPGSPLEECVFQTKVQWEVIEEFKAEEQKVHIRKSVLYPVPKQRTKAYLRILSNSNSKFTPNSVAYSNSHLLTIFSFWVRVKCGKENQKWHW